MFIMHKADISISSANDALPLHHASQDTCNLEVRVRSRFLKPANNRETGFFSFFRFCSTLLRRQRTLTPETSRG